MPSTPSIVCKAQTDFEFINRLPQSLQHWNYMHAPPHVECAFSEHDATNAVSWPGRAPVTSEHFPPTTSLGPQSSLCPQPGLLVAQWLRSSMESPSSQPPGQVLAQPLTLTYALEPGIAQEAASLPSTSYLLGIQETYDGNFSYL